MAVVATGFFDGVHLGHRKVIDTLLRAAASRSEQSVVLTFWPHPRTVLQNGARELRLITPLEEKKQLLYEMGVDKVEVLTFDMDFASMTAKEYLQKIVIEQYKGTSIVIGYDNRLGCDAMMGEDLEKLVLEMGLKYIPCAPFSDYSSTKIRNCIAAGKIENANSMLGRPYSMKGVVVGGHRLGRTIGYPTANVRFYEPLQILPYTGAYFTEVFVEGKKYYGMTNAGELEKIETHIFDFEDDIYGKDIELKFIKFLRDERSFESIDDLKRQLEIDEMSCRNIFLNL